MPGRALPVSRRIGLRCRFGFDPGVVLKKLHDLLVGDLVVDFHEAVAFLQVFQEFVGSDLVHRRQGLNALEDFLLRHLDVFLLGDALNEKGKSIKGSKLLILGLAYKKDIDDIRESPSLKLIEIFNTHGAVVEYNDPYVAQTRKIRKYDFKMNSVPLTEKNLRKYDCVLVSTDHSSYDHAFIAKHASLVIDTRNAMKNIRKGKIVKA